MSMFLSGNGLFILIAYENFYENIMKYLKAINKNKNSIRKTIRKVSETTIFNLDSETNDSNYFKWIRS